MNKRIKHLFMVLVIGLCLSMPLAVSASTEADNTVNDPTAPASSQCPDSKQQSTTSTTPAEGEAGSTEGQASESDNDCTEWQTAPVSWNS